MILKCQTTNCDTATVNFLYAFRIFKITALQFNVAYYNSNFIRNCIVFDGKPVCIRRKSVFSHVVCDVDRSLNP